MSAPHLPKSHPCRGATGKEGQFCTPQHQLHPNDLARAVNQLSSNRLYRPASKSSSADLFIKLPEVTIEVQDKSGLAIGVSFADIREEVAKSIGKGRVLWLLIALKLKESLGHWVGEEKPLVLTPGCYQEGKRKHGGLLYRPVESTGWQKRIWMGTWQDVTTRLEAKGNALTVRTDLELVIPHPSHVKMFLGDEDFQVVKQIAERTRDGVSSTTVRIPFLSRFYNFTQPPAPGSAALQRPPAVWVCQLGSPDGKDFEIVGNAFQVKGVLTNVDDLKKAIDPSFSPFQSSKIYIYSQKDGRWVREDEEAAVNRGKSKADCYGFMLPAGAAGAA
ncbi:unnamed protein product [Effrenium voratum]|uniref:Uncharacterized protein n=1 Tax=Effrenium voratum TaxID=2562239 RepID=A0AA36HX78_9DINO|nr:unnamed protein product [Effrenium voratum]